MLSIRKNNDNCYSNLKIETNNEKINSSFINCRIILTGTLLESHSFEISPTAGP